ncbi:MAG: hypothetical protein VX546_09020 [Myxococcota bacterium]|nr:hypothetical protein [Myxococcota bacterium]
MKNFTAALWLLKLGAPLNLYFLATTFSLPCGSADPHILIPAQILFAVSAYRCLFPMRYQDNVVFHDSLLSSAFLTRMLATVTEVAYIYLFSHVLRLLNVHHVAWVDWFSWAMVFQAAVSQGFVWWAILTKRRVFYYYEELGWAAIFAANTLASVYLYATLDSLGGREILLQLNLLFGLFYLPWQAVHLITLWSDARSEGDLSTPDSRPTRDVLVEGLHASIYARTPARDAESWGGWVGLTWMVSYWAAVIPVWVYWIVETLVH